MHNIVFPTDQDIVLNLDGYQDLFSDFDARPYDKKALSYDFLEEIKRASLYKNYLGINLKFLIPKNRRDKYEEKVISRRLKEHFLRHFLLLEKEKWNIIKQGFLFTLAGILLMIIATWVLFGEADHSFFKSLMIVILEPGGWFLFWEGLSLMVFHSKVKKTDFSFYKKMSNCCISFSDA